MKQRHRTKSVRQKTLCGRNSYYLQRMLWQKTCLQYMYSRRNRKYWVRWKLKRDKTMNVAICVRKPYTMTIYTAYLDNILFYTTFSGVHSKAGKCSEICFVYERIYLTWGKKQGHSHWCTCELCGCLNMSDPWFPPWCASGSP